MFPTWSWNQALGLFEARYMVRKDSSLIDGFIGSANVLVSAVNCLIEERLLRETAPQLKFSHLKILKSLTANGPGTIGDIAAFLGVSNPAASKAVEKLVRRRLLRRAAAEGDRRASAVTLSANARRLLERYEDARSRWLARLFRDISGAELRGATALLDRLSARLVAEVAHPEDTCLQCGIHLQKRCVVREAARKQCSYEQQRSKSKVRTDVSDNRNTAAKDETPAGSGPPMGTPRQRAAGV
jgi:DNA-binding MarR family transcriptional regulator